MKVNFKKILFGLFLLIASQLAHAWSQGIYISQSTLERTDYLKYLIQNAKEVGIDTFVVDLNKPSELYRKNIKLVVDSGLHYVVRIVMFPGGGTDAQIKSLSYREAKYRLVQEALAMGASQVQLDYIRYRPTQAPSSQNAQNVLRVIEWFKTRLQAKNIPLQIDVFGISSFGPSKYIGQDIRVFANAIDALCPMLYPSHFEPYKLHSIQPYETIYKSINSIKKQLNNQVPFKIYTYIEMSNYRYKYSESNHLGYIQAQIDAARDSGTNGWYAWSANNYYDRLFKVLRSEPKPTFNVSEEKNKLSSSDIKQMCQHPMFSPKFCQHKSVVNEADAKRLEDDNIRNV